MTTYWENLKIFSGKNPASWWYTNLISQLWWCSCLAPQLSQAVLPRGDSIVVMGEMVTATARPGVTAGTRASVCPCGAGLLCAARVTHKPGGPPVPWASQYQFLPTSSPRRGTVTLEEKIAARVTGWLCGMNPTSRAWQCKKMNGQTSQPLSRSLNIHFIELRRVTRALLVMKVMSLWKRHLSMLCKAKQLLQGRERPD